MAHRTNGVPIGRTARLRRPQLSDEVVAYLRDQIMSGELPPGTFIRLEDVAATLGVSITPVREALLTLRGEDMVELEPRRGYKVAPLSRQDIVDVFALQAHIAGELAVRAAAQITADELADLKEKQQGLRDAVRTATPAEIEEREFDFHRALNRIAAARKLSWFLHTALRYTPVRFYSTDAGWRASMLSAHEELLTALEARDGEQATAVMARHFTDGAERLLAHLDARGAWS
ncbi:GntR family transcriptional regulator [Cryptosporangium aurantiacum]|uniref:Transcriptional regulator, GntR family n=1 Tax=Cryptosporangium aurantiacum TaxID=134849 RepID=A0A1M7RAR1_9ACTN|nr:GntR family transcriptional regulator [Cryptosporangium aurantiacum]SHN43374.1 transcriptional regulator, GntR family [Cryptosporangium aurantiacum]